MKFEFTEVEVTAGVDVAFATAIGHCFDDGQPIDFRWTTGLRKRDGRWVITHEHHSVPAGK
jgi:ketosteroid isomerase-like protein